jgi:Family of unknown function (DUF6049)
LLRVTGLTALAALTLLPLLAQAAPAQAAPAQARSQARSHSQGGITLAIDSISPQTAEADSTVVVSGTVTNDSSSTLTGLSVQLYSSDTQFSARELMDSYVEGGTAPYVTPEGIPFAFTGSIRAGGTAAWHAEFTAASAGMSVFGVYPLVAQLTTQADDTALSTDRTLLPFWPGSAAGIAKLKIAWIWPLIDQPHAQACPALTNNDLAASVGGGRLDTLLAAGAAAHTADLTWAIDPALLGDVDTMTKPYQAGGNPADCAGATAEPASTAAGTWLKTLTASTASAPVIITPYANVDMAALVHQGMVSDLQSAYHLGEEVAGHVLNRSFGINVALPAGGFADQTVLTALAGKKLASSVVLSSTEMPVPPDDSFTPDNAVTTVHTMAGTTMNVLLADSTLTGLLAQVRPDMTKASQFALEQRFLAETAMIAAEVPDSARSLVVSPPETWGPSLMLAGNLLQESTSAPWLQPTALGSLTGSQPRAALAVSQHNPRELSSKYLTGTLGPVESQLNVFQSMLYRPSGDYTRGLTAALAATESSAWRGSGASLRGGLALVKDLKAYVRHAEDQVGIPSAQEEVQMAGASGELPVTIQNGLTTQNGLPDLAVKVTLNTSVAVAANVTSTLTVSRAKPVIIPAGVAHLVKLAIHSASQGPHSITLSLTSADGTVLTFADTTLTVDSTRYGERILILIVGAIGLLLLTSAFRSSKRKKHGTEQEQDAAGNVIPDPAGRPTGRSGEPKEEEAGAPDDLADARRGADDT